MKINDPTKAQYQGLNMHSIGRWRGIRRSARVTLLILILFFIIALIASNAWRSAEATGDMGLAQTPSPAPINHAPVAHDDLYVNLKPFANIGPADGVLVNDTDEDGDTLTAELVTDAFFGDLQLHGTGGFTYYSSEYYSSATDVFYYRVSDGKTKSNVAKVVLDFGERNRPPVADDRSYSVLEDQSFSDTLYSSSTDPDHDPLEFHIVSYPAYGRFDNNWQAFLRFGMFTYIPLPNFYGADSFTYYVKDLERISNVGTVTISVISVNDPPTAHDDQLRLSQNSGWVNVDVLENDSFVPDTGETFSVIAVTQPANGVAELNADTVRYMPAAGFSGLDSFTYTMSDGNGGSDSATVHVTVAPPPTIAVRFSRAEYNVMEGCVPATLTMVLDHQIASETVSVDYSITGGTASQKSDYTYAAGTLVPAMATPASSTSGRVSFTRGDTSRQIQVLISDDGYAEGTETVTFTLSNPVGVYLAEPSSATLNINDNDASESQTNPIDDPAMFVCQHYHDFLHRQPDAVGLAFWTNEIMMCGADAACVNEKRHNVSAAFFLAVEFQETAYFVERLYEACLSRHPTYEEFLRDIQSVGADVTVGVDYWQQRLETNKQAFAEQFVQRAEFLRRYRVGISAEQYVNEIFGYAGTGWDYPEWRAAVDAYGSGDMRGRAAAMRKVMESASVFRRYFNRGFVLAEYLGYLRRDPSDPPDVNWDGYDFWLAKIDNHSDYYENVTNAVMAHARIRRAEMIRAFIESNEYRERFGKP